MAQRSMLPNDWEKHERRSMLPREKCWHRRWVSSLPRDSLLLASIHLMFRNSKFEGSCFRGPSAPLLAKEHEHQCSCSFVSSTYQPLVYRSLYRVDGHMDTPANIEKQIGGLWHEGEFKWVSLFPWTGLFLRFCILKSRRNLHTICPTPR